MKRTPKLYLKIFLSTLYLSAFTFGGGYVIVSLMQKKFVETYKWISKEEMIDIVAIAQSSPGAIAVNASIMVGYRLAGVLGALCSLVGAILPPLVIISGISFAYTAFRDNIYIDGFLRGMQAGVCAVVIDVIYKMSRNFFKEKDYFSVVLMLIAFSLSYFLRVNVIFIVLGAIIFSIIYHQISKKIVNKKIMACNGNGGNTAYGSAKNSGTDNGNGNENDGGTASSNNSRNNDISNDNSARNSGTDNNNGSARNSGTDNGNNSRNSDITNNNSAENSGTDNDNGNENGGGTVNSNNSRSSDITNNNSAKNSGMDNGNGNENDGVTDNGNNSINNDITNNDCENSGITVDRKGRKERRKNGLS